MPKTQARTPTPATELDGVSFAYRGSDRAALYAIDLTTGPGQFVVLMGRTGAGKSTLCRCLNGLVPQFHKSELTGEVCILGESVAGRRLAELAPTREVFADDAVLRRAGIRAPRLVEFARQLGCMALSPQELAGRTIRPFDSAQGRPSTGSG